MARRFRFVALLALLVASVAGLAACGGNDDSSGDANALLKDTFGPNQNINSGKLNLSLAFRGNGVKGLSGPLALRVTGPFQSQGKGKLPKVDLDMTLGGSGANFSAGVVSTGDKGWLKLQGTAFLVDDPTFQQFKRGYEQSAAKDQDSSGAPTLKSLGIDPLRWLRDPKVAGTEETGGAETEHITAGVDVGSFLDDVNTLLGKAGQLGQATAGLPTKLTDQQRKDIEASVKSAALDVWTGKDDHALRRMKLAVGIDVPEAVRPRAAGLTTGTLRFDLLISDLNGEQQIVAPRNARPLADLKQLIAGGATGATAAPQTQTTPSAAPSSGSSKYLECVAAAGSDVAKIQKCATLAGQ